MKKMCRINYRPVYQKFMGVIEDNAPEKLFKKEQWCSVQDIIGFEKKGRSDRLLRIW